MLHRGLHLLHDFEHLHDRRTLQRATHGRGAISGSVAGDDLLVHDLWIDVDAAKHKTGVGGVGCFVQRAAGHARFDEWHHEVLQRVVVRHQDNCWLERVDVHRGDGGDPLSLRYGDKVP